MPKQLSLFSENKPGRISRITEILKNENINIKAITISSGPDEKYGVIKLLLDRPDDAFEAFQHNNIPSKLQSIVAIKVTDSPGGLNSASTVLANKGINVKDAYGFTIREKDLAVFVFQVDDVHETESILKEAGFDTVGDKELYYI